MAEVKYVSSPQDVPATEKYILVKYGKTNGLERHSRGLTVTVDRSQEPNLREAHTVTAIGEAQGVTSFRATITLIRWRAVQRGHEI